MTNVKFNGSRIGRGADPNFRHLGDWMPSEVKNLSASDANALTAANPDFVKTKIIPEPEPIGEVE